MVTVLMTLPSGQMLEVELSSFSRQSLLEHSSLDESQLMENDPEDEDAAVDMDVEVLKSFVVVTFTTADQEVTRYCGTRRDWEGK